jgi:hypothetical protein
MKKQLLFSLLVPIMAGCQHRSGTCYSKDQWKIPGDYSYMTLKGSPREVREFRYHEGEDSTGIFRKRTGDDWLYVFDRDGNVTTRNTYMSDHLAVVSEITYSPSGYTMRSWANNSPELRDTSILTYHVMADGRFKSTSNRKTNKSIVWITSFSDDGNKCIRTSFQDTNATGKPMQTATAWYDGQKLLKTEVLDSNGKSEERLYYSQGDSPDSILFLNRGKVLEKEVYVNNKYGDPERYFQLMGTDTVEHTVISYVYDSKGNWTKNKETSMNRLAMPGILNSQDGKTVVVREREIKY